MADKNAQAQKQSGHLSAKDKLRIWFEKNSTMVFAVSAAIVVATILQTYWS